MDQNVIVKHFLTELQGIAARPPKHFTLVHRDPKPQSVWEWTKIVSCSKAFVRSNFKKLSAERVAGAIVDNLQACKDAGGIYLAFDDVRYPEALRHIDYPPLGLFLLGNHTLLRQQAVAVVGSRRPHPRTLDAAESLGTWLCERSSLSIVSGGAFGCDIATHRGTLRLDRGSRAVVVLASGLGRPTPNSHTLTFHHIVEQHGALVSERLWYAKAMPYHFPRRNRIIAGMARSLVVLDAGSRSGTLITAHLALDAGREVIAFQPPWMHGSGIDDLIRDGAQSFTSNHELTQILQEISCFPG